MHFARVGCLMLLLAASAANAAPPATAPATQSATVSIDNFTFDPATLTIAAGTKVTWTNHDDVPHTATAKEGAFKSAALDTDESFSFVFATPGTYAYYCAVHPHMTGKIIVTK